MMKKKTRKYAILIFTIDFFFKKYENDDKYTRENTSYFVEFEQTKYILYLKIKSFDEK